MRENPILVDFFENHSAIIGNGPEFFITEVRQQKKYGYDLIKIVAIGGFASAYDSDVYLVQIFVPYNDIVRVDENSLAKKPQFFRDKPRRYADKIKASRELIIGSNLKSGYGTEICLQYIIPMKVDENSAHGLKV